MGVFTGSANIRELELWVCLLGQPLKDRWNCGCVYWVSHYKRAGIVGVFTGSATIRQLELWVWFTGSATIRELELWVGLLGQPPLESWDCPR